MGIGVKEGEMGREIRKVPRGWSHPRKEHRPEQYQPLYDKDFETAATEWKRGFYEWESGAHEDLQEHPERRTEMEFWEWDGGPPDREYHRPKWAEEPTCFQVYETVSEGTPVSPVFETEDALLAWLIKQGHSEHAARKFIEYGSAPSFIVMPRADGLPRIESGIDALGLGE